MWYGTPGVPGLALCGNGELDGMCTRNEDTSATCYTNTSLDYVPSIDVSPINSAEKAIHSCLINELEYGNTDSCFIIGSLGGIFNERGVDYLSEGTFPDLDVTSENFKSRVMNEILGNVQGMMPKLLDNGLPKMTGPSMPIIK